MSGNKKISQLPSAGTLDGTELVPVVQGGNTVQTTAQDIADLGGGSQSLQDVINVDNHANGEIIKSQSDNSNVTLLFDVLTNTISNGADTTVVEQTPTGLNITSPSITKNSVELATINDIPTIKTKYKESFTYSGIALTLAHTCTFMYSLNWGNLALNETVDYSFSGTTLTILNTNINNGDLLYATYE